MRRCLINKQRTNKLYNYLVNTFGLSKKNILEHVEARLEDIISKNILPILESNNIQEIILNRIAYFIKNGEVSYYQEKNTFNDVVKEQIKQVVEDQLKKNCEIKFQFTPNSIKFVKES